MNKDIIPPKLCDYGCGREATHQFKNGKWCCSIDHRKCKSLIEKNRIGHIGLQKSKEIRNNMRIGQTGRKHPEETKIKMRGKTPHNKGKKGLYKHPNEFKERQRIRMLNGGAITAIKGIKNPSNEEIKLRNMVKELCLDCEFQYPVFNYSLDVALVSDKIAIEYDGYYHFDSEYHKEYHKNRKEKIENEGWKFLKYNIFKKFPDLKTLKEDIKKIKNLIK